MANKLPDFKEVLSIGGKLFNDLKKSVCEIIEDYNKKHCDDSCKEKPCDDEASHKKSHSKKAKSTEKH